MLDMRKLPSYLRHLDWYIGHPSRIPLCSDLGRYLPLPDLGHARVRWPNKYSWSLAASRLDPIKAEMARFLPVESVDVARGDLDWHMRGGFPVPAERHHVIGKPCNPVQPNDIRGDVFEIRVANRAVRCAFDYSDYPIVSTDMLERVDLYFKCMAPPGPLPARVMRVGYFANSPRLLGKARERVLRNHGERTIAIYGRFGTLTDSQPLRQAVVNRLRDSGLNFTGGFAVNVYAAYLKEMMSAKIAVDLPGHGPISHRMVEAMALGAVVVSPKAACGFPEDLIDGVHYVTFREDGSNAVEVSERLLADDDRRQAIAAQAMTFFDRNFSTESMVRRMLQAAVSGSAAWQECST